LVVAAAAAAAAAVAVHPWTWGRELREYPRPDHGVYVSYGDSFEHDLLPHYQLALPCDVDGLRWGDDEDLIGSSGRLYVKFVASAGCLGRFITANHLDTTTSSSFPDAPARYGWSVDVGVAFYTGQTDLTDTTVAVSGGTDKSTVYVVVEHR
jgi:hypothetical protein